MPVACCDGCGTHISLSYFAGRNQAILQFPGAYAGGYERCTGCGRRFCGRCIKKSSGLFNPSFCSRCGWRLRDELDFQLGMKLEQVSGQPPEWFETIAVAITSAPAELLDLMRPTATDPPPFTSRIRRECDLAFVEGVPGRDLPAGYPFSFPFLPGGVPRAEAEKGTISLQYAEPSEQFAKKLKRVLQHLAWGIEDSPGTTAIRASWLSYRRGRSIFVSCRP